MDAAMLLQVLSEGLFELGRAEQRSVDSGKPRMEVRGTTLTPEHIAALGDVLTALAADQEIANWLTVEYRLACITRGIEP